MFAYAFDGEYKICKRSHSHSQSNDIKIDDHIYLCVSEIFSWSISDKKCMSIYFFQISLVLFIVNFLIYFMYTHGSY